MAASSTATARKRGPGRPFVKGQSGNPSGRAKQDKGLIAALEAVVDKDELAQALWKQVVEGEAWAIKYVYDRIEGSPTQRHEVDHEAVQRAMEHVAEEGGLDLATLRRDTEEIAGRLRLVK